MIELANGTTVIERSCERLIDYLDGQIGLTFKGSFCYEKRLTSFGRKLVKECICVKNLCNSATDRNDTEKVMLQLLQNVHSNVLSLKNASLSQYIADHFAATIVLALLITLSNNYM